MPTHTPGRLSVSETGKLYVQGQTPHGGVIKIHSPWIEDAWDDDEEADANMRRLAACWNACDGIPTDALEAGRLSANALRLLEIDRDRLQADLSGLSERVQPLHSAAQKALAALSYHTEQTRPIPQSEEAIKALIVALAAFR